MGDKKYIINNVLVDDIKTILHSAKSKIYQTINHTMTQTYWEIGKRIVNEEQAGETRAKYGKEIIKTLSLELTKEFGKGYSVDNLENMRKFYSAYPKSETVSRKFKLSYSHYIFLARMTNKDERDFYEIESIQNSWSLRELKRQFNSGLFERLALSSDKQHSKASKIISDTLGVNLIKPADPENKSTKHIKYIPFYG